LFPMKIIVFSKLLNIMGLEFIIHIQNSLFFQNQNIGNTTAKA